MKRVYWLFLLLFLDDITCYFHAKPTLGSLYICKKKFFLYLSYFLDIVSLKESSDNKESFYHKINNIYRNFIHAKSECLFHDIEYNTVDDPASGTEVTEISCFLTLLPNQCLIIPELLGECDFSQSTRQKDPPPSVLCRKKLLTG